ncbi:hypothetical protein ppKF707_1061 [Metapseudomonas furukawaii]|nr:hypothetical protein ppKF707_1061 [Pseudomonas furukawaii]
MAEAVHHVGELGDDGRIDGSVETGGNQELIDVRLDLAGELLEHQVLVLHLGAELGGLEQALAIPHQGGGIGGNRPDRLQQPLVEEVHIPGFDDHLFGVIHQAVVLGVEHMVHGGQADVLVHPAIAGDVVGVQQFVVVGGGTAIVGAGDRVGVRGQQRPCLAIEGVGAVGDIVQEGMAGAHGVGQADALAAIGGRVAFHQEGPAVAIAHHHLRIAIGALDEVAVRVRGQQRDIAHIGIGQVDAENVARLGLDGGPGGHAAQVRVVPRTEGAVVTEIAIGDQLAGGHRAIGGGDVGAQEHLVGRVRAVGLVLVDEGRGGVGVLMDIVGSAQHTIRPRLVGGASQHQEVGGASRHE